MSLNIPLALRSALERALSWAEIDSNLVALRAGINAIGAQIEDAFVQAFDGLKGAGKVGYSGLTPYGANTVGDALQTFIVRTYSELIDAIAAAKISGAPTRILVCDYITHSTTIVVDGPNILIEGKGSDTFHDVGNQGALKQAGLRWTGAVGGTQLRFESPVGLTRPRLYGGGVKNLYFGGDDIAGIGLQIMSWAGGTFEGMGFVNHRTVAVDMGVVATLGEARDCQDNRIIDVSSRHFETTGGTGGLLRLDGDLTANASFNHFEGLRCQFINGTAFLLRDCDNNYLKRCRGTRAGGGTGLLVLCEGGATVGQTARANEFDLISGAAPITCKGTPAFASPSLYNVFVLDLENGTPIPTFETGATGEWIGTDGTYSGSSGHVMQRGLAGEDAFAVAQARALAFANCSMTLYNGSQNHLNLLDGTNSFGVRINSDGSLELSRFGGTKGYAWSVAAIPDAADDAAAAVAGVAVGRQYRTGSILKVRVA